MSVFLLIAFVCSIIAFLVHQFVDKGDDFPISVAGWLILTLVFYLAHLLFNVTIGRRSSNPSNTP